MSTLVTNEKKSYQDKEHIKQNQIDILELKYSITKIKSQQIGSKTEWQNQKKQSKNLKDKTQKISNLSNREKIYY